MEKADTIFSKTLRMKPNDFIHTWQDNPLSERASAQSHFIGLCGLLDLAPPSPKTVGAFEFEKGATKTTGGDGWADVWLKGAFAWEYKKAKANLDKAYEQVQRYAPALDNPPLLIVSDTQSIVIRTAFTGAVQERHDISIEDLINGETRDLLRRAFVDPASFRPKRTRADLTEDAAATFADLALRLRQKGFEAQDVAHFVNRLVFCMFAEDVRLLPEKMFEKMVFASDSESFDENCRALFAAMANRGGRVGFTPIPWFNGGLFDDDTALPVGPADIEMLRLAAKMDWSQIDASLLGTLFERGLDPDKRSQLGAHYTDAVKVMQIIEPVVLRPLKAEWDEAREIIAKSLEEERAVREEAASTRAAAKSGALTRRANSAHQRAVDAHLGFLERLRKVRVLDPACGSGNFLNLALTALKDFEHRANLDAEALGLPRPAPQVGPECVLGIELNPYAAELARVSTWIAEIQWMRRNGFEASKDPILKPLGTIECRDAVLGKDLKPASWPAAEFIIGNPPFLGNKRMISELGEDYTVALRKAWPDVPGGADLVAYWVAGAWQAVKAGRAARAGLVATNSIRGGANRETLKPIVEDGRIFEAWSDEPWNVAGAAVRVSMIMFDAASDGGAQLDGELVDRIAGDLSAGGADLSNLYALKQNAKSAFVGVILNGEGFEISGQIAREWLQAATNANGKKNQMVLRPTLNGDDFNGARPDKWVIDFGPKMSEHEASFFEAPFEHIRATVKGYRQRLKDDGTFAVRAKNEREIWWRHARPRPALRKAVAHLHRYIATPMVSTYRNFGFLETSILPDQKLVVFARDDFTFFGILESRFHLAWTFATCSWIGSGNDVTYAKNAVFETFPFPEGLTPNIPASDYADDPRAIAIAEAARDLNDKREAWLNPPDLVRRAPEVVEGYPDRLHPLDEAAENELKKRSLTNLYNTRPAWLNGLHVRLDAAVANAYGWPEDITKDDALVRLLALNHSRAEKGL